MPRTRGPFDEGVSLLYPENHHKFGGFPQPHWETPIIKGAASQLRRWPSDLFFAFLAACFIIGILVFLIFVTVAFCLPAVVDNRVVDGLEIEESSNVYFLKLANRTWSTREFCYIETASRKHSDLTVYLINLFKNEATEKTVKEQSGNATQAERKVNSTKNVNDSLQLTPEEKLRKQLVSGYANVRSIDVSVERLFKRSKLSNIAKSLDDDTLEMAAKAQLLWNSPGIVLNPEMYCNLESVQQFLCSKNKESCVRDNLATIEIKNDIQATEVPCQAFIGYFMHELSKNKLNDKYTMKRAIEEYCPRLYYCPEIRIIDLSPKCPTDELNCPIVYSSILLDDPSVENFVT